MSAHYINPTQATSVLIKTRNISNRQEKSDGIYVCSARKAPILFSSAGLFLFFEKKSMYRDHCLVCVVVVVVLVQKLFGHNFYTIGGHC